MYQRRRKRFASLMKIPTFNTWPESPEFVFGEQKNSFYSFRIVSDPENTNNLQTNQPTVGIEVSTLSISPYSSISASSNHLFRSQSFSILSVV